MTDQEIVRAAAVGVAYRKLTHTPVRMDEIAAEMETWAENPPEEIEAVITVNAPTIEKFSETIVFWATHIDL